MATTTKKASANGTSASARTPQPSNRIVTLDEFIIRSEKDFEYATGELTGLLRDIGVAAKIINREVNKAGLVNIIGVADGGDNASGDTQQKLDVYANDKLIECLQNSGECCAIGSEENEDIIQVAPVNNKASTRWLYQTATKYIVTTGERLKETLARDNGYDTTRMESVTTGIDTRRFTPGDKAAARAKLGLAADRTYLGIVATLRSWKGHHYLLEALQKLTQPDLHLLIVGDGPRREFLGEMVERLNMQDRVTFVGNQDDVVPWLQSFDLFVLPSYANEGVPQSVLQAMLVGLPVISTPVGSITEAVVDGETGIIVQPEQVEPLRQALQKLLDQPALAAQMGAAGRERALGRFSMEVMLDKMESVFRRALA